MTFTTKKAYHSIERDSARQAPTGAICTSLASISSEDIGSAYLLCRLTKQRDRLVMQEISIIHCQKLVDGREVQAKPETSRRHGSLARGIYLSNNILYF